MNLVEFIEANKNKQVKNISNELIQLVNQLVAESKSRAEGVSEAWRTVDGKLECFCYYHKVWEVVTTETYGSKQGSKHGFNNMCKSGTNAWTKWNKMRKQVDDVVLKEVVTGTCKVENIETRKATLHAEVDKQYWSCK
jgi:hypothetical protein